MSKKEITYNKGKGINRGFPSPVPETLKKAKVGNIVKVKLPKKVSEIIESIDRMQKEVQALESYQRREVPRGIRPR